jgi:hypothetical protein
MDSCGHKPLENNYESDRISDASSGQTNVGRASRNPTPFLDIRIFFSLFLNHALLHIGLMSLFFALALLANGRCFLVTYWMFNGAEGLLPLYSGG